MQPTVRLTRALPAERTVVAEASTSSTAGPSSNLPVVGRIIERLTVAEQTATCARGGSGRRRRRVRSNSTRRETKPTVHELAGGQAALQAGATGIAAGAVAAVREVGRVRVATVPLLGVVVVALGGEAPVQDVLTVARRGRCRAARCDGTVKQRVCLVQ